MKRAEGLQVPHIIVTPERKFQHIPSIKISIDGASSESEHDNDDDDNEVVQMRPRLRPLPSSLRC